MARNWVHCTSGPDPGDGVYFCEALIVYSGIMTSSSIRSRDGDDGVRSVSRAVAVLGKQASSGAPDITLEARGADLTALSTSWALVQDEDKVSLNIPIESRCKHLVSGCKPHGVLECTN